MTEAPLLVTYLSSALTFPCVSIRPLSMTGLCASSMPAPWRLRFIYRLKHWSKPEIAALHRTFTCGYLFGKSHLSFVSFLSSLFFIQDDKLIRIKFIFDNSWKYRDNDTVKPAFIVPLEESEPLGTEQKEAEHLCLSAETWSLWMYLKYPKLTESRGVNFVLKSELKWGNIQLTTFALFYSPFTFMDHLLFLEVYILPMSLTLKTLLPGPIPRDPIHGVPWLQFSSLLQVLLSSWKASIIVWVAKPSTNPQNFSTSSKQWMETSDLNNFPLYSTPATTVETSQAPLSPRAIPSRNLWAQTKIPPTLTPQSQCKTFKSSSFS